MRQAGAKIIPFNTLRDDRLPKCDGLFIGGGFPETQAAALSANSSLRDDIKESIARGLPSYVECGGLMYLSKSLTCREGSFPMVGAVPGNTVMRSTPVGRGYVCLEHTCHSLWPDLGGRGEAVAAHEFHYATLENLPENSIFAFRVTRGFGIDGRRDGLVVGNTLGTFSHQRNINGNNWVHQFLAFVRQNRVDNQVSSISN